MSRAALVDLYVAAESTLGMDASWRIDEETDVEGLWWIVDAEGDLLCKVPVKMAAEFLVALLNDWVDAHYEGVEVVEARRAAVKL